MPNAATLTVWPSDSVAGTSWGQHGVSGNPQDLNRYTYALNNPLKYTDPTGHLPILALVGLSALAGAAINMGVTAIATHVAEGRAPTAGEMAGAAISGAVGGALAPMAGPIAGSAIGITNRMLPMLSRTGMEAAINVIGGAASDALGGAVGDAIDQQSTVTLPGIAVSTAASTASGAAVGGGGPISVPLTQSTNTLPALQSALTGPAGREPSRFTWARNPWMAQRANSRYNRTAFAINVGLSLFSGAAAGQAGGHAAQQARGARNE